MSRFSSLFVGNRKAFVPLLSASIVVIVAYFLVNAFSAYRLSLDKAEEQAGSLASAVEMHARQTVEGVGTALDGVERLLAGRDPGRFDPGMHLVLEQAASVSPSILAVIVLDADGRARYTSRVDEPVDVDLSDRRYFRVHREDRPEGLFIGEPVRGRVGYSRGRWILPVSRALTGPDGRFAGVVAAVLSVEYLASFYDSIFMGERGVMALLHRNGTVVAFGERNGALVQRSLAGTDLLEQMQRGHHDTLEYDLLGEGTPRIVSYHAAEEFPLVALVALSREDVLADWRRATVRSFLLVVVFTGVLMLAGASALRFAAREDKARDALAQSEARFRQLIEGSIQAVLVHWDFEPIFANRAMMEMVGCSDAETFYRTSFLDFHPPEDRQLALARVRQRMHGSEAAGRFETRLQRLDGATIWVEVLATRMSWEGRPVVLATLIDISERKRAEQERQLLAQAVEHTPETILITDREGTIQFANSALESTTGYARAEVLGRTPRLFKSGANDERVYRGLWATITRGEVWRGRLVNRRKDGSTYDEQLTISPVREADGRITHYVAVKQDVTAEVQTEQRLRQAQKLEAIGALASGIAHDFNNILTPIIGYGEILQRRMEPESREAEAVQVISRAAHRAKDLIAQILLFSRQSQGRRALVDVSSLAKEVAKMLRSTLPRTIEVRQELAPDLGLVHADLTQVHTVLMNLGVNAGQAMPDGGTLTFAFDTVVLDGYPVARSTAVSGRYVRMAVRDTGVGMHEATRLRIFEPFFTTKEVGQGTGLGLSTVYGIVQKHGGFIEVDSAPGAGSEFRVYLPAAETAGAGAEDAELPARAGTGHVLFVDDEEMIGAYGKEGLEQMGFNVTATTCPRRALELLREDPHAFDVVITDHTMPQMTGERLGGEVRRIRGDLPVILCSGNPGSLDAGQLEAHGIRELVHKPYSMRELSGAVFRACSNGTGQAAGEG